MKKLISIALLTALITLLLGIFATASEISNLEITFTPPSVGEGVSTSMITVPDEMSCLDAVLLDEDVDTLLANSSTVSTLATFLTDNKLSVADDSEKEYLVVFSVLPPDDTTISSTLVVTDTNSNRCGYINTIDYPIYAYVSFTPATSQSSSGTNSTEEKAVMVDCVVGENARTIHSFDINWGSMNFTYTANGEWDPSTHTFKNVTSGEWSHQSGANKISIVNHSNTSITATFSYTPATGYAGVSGDFYSDNALSVALDANKLLLPTAVNTLPANAPTGSAYLSLSGIIDNPLTDEFQCGTVTVTIN